MLGLRWWLLLACEEELLVLPRRLHLLPARVHDAEEEGVHLFVCVTIDSVYYMYISIHLQPPKMTCIRAGLYT